VLAGAALAEWWRDGSLRRPPRRVVAALAGLAILHLAGGVCGKSPSEPTRTLRVAAIQGDIDQDAKWSREWIHQILEIYLDLSRQAIELGAEVIVWPETAVPGFLELSPEIREPIVRLARESGTAFVLGATGAGLDARGERIEAVFDSAFVLTPEGDFTSRYDKTHLVPFGEFVPFRSLVGHFFEAIARGLANTDVTAGAAPRAVNVEIAGPERARQVVKVGVPICYELLFPDLVRRFGGDGAQVLFAITNDAWYGRTGAPYQFLAMTALRSAESGLWTVRAANSGVSAIIDGSGRVREATDIFVRDLVVADVPLAEPGARQTFYVRHGDVFAWICWAGAIGIALRTRFGGSAAGRAQA
jgi:apolipoprotein N-acyltransferase